MKYRKKPIVVDAAQLCWKEWSVGLPPLLEGILSEENPARAVPTFSDTCGEQGPNYIEITIPTLEGKMIAKHGDWIIRGVKGEVYPCKPDIFVATYEQVPLVQEARREG